MLPGMTKRSLRGVVALLVAGLSWGTAADRAHAEPAGPPPESGQRCQKPVAGTKITAYFDEKVTLDDLARWLYTITCKPVVFGANLGERSLTVKVVGGGGMTIKQAIALVGNAAEAAGLVMREKASGFVVLPDPKAPRACPPPDPQEAMNQAIDRGITAVDEHRVKVTRALIKQVMDNPMEVAKGARVLPSIQDGKPNGFKLYAIRPTSLYAKLGLRNGDTVTAVNGVALDSPEAALALYETLRESKVQTVTMDLSRRGAAVKLTIELVD
jgi:hypothetical protein